MREYTFQITKFLTGLREDPRRARNQAGLEQAVNVVASPYGLEPYKDIVFPLDPDIVSVTYPWPQLIRGKGITLLFYEQEVYEVNELSSPWSRTQLNTVDISDGTTAKPISIDLVLGRGGVWHFLDMQGAWYAFNGTSVVFQQGLDKAHGEAVKTFAQDAVKINTGTYHKGRAILGGFDDTLWDSEWASILNTWKADEPAGLDFAIDDIGGNWIIWSGIGAGDFPLWLFYPDIYTYSTDKDADEIIRQLQVNGFGIMPMEGQGEVLVVEPLGDSLAVYQEDMVTLLRPFSNEYASGYGVHRRLRIGCYSRASVAGSEEAHFFIDTAGDLWGVTEQGFQRIGYKEWLFPELGPDLRMSFDERRNRLYISSSKTHVLSPFNEGVALTEATERVTSVVFVEGGLVGIAESSVEDDADYVYLKTNPFDMNLRSMKTVTGVEVGIDSEYHAFAALDFRYDRSGPWIEGDWVFLNKEGYAFNRVTAVDFRLRIKVEGKDDVHIDYGYIKWQLSDKRYVRGFYQQANIQEQE